MFLCLKHSTALPNLVGESPRGALRLGSMPRPSLSALVLRSTHSKDLSEELGDWAHLS